MSCRCCDAVIQGIGTSLNLYHEWNAYDADGLFSIPRMLDVKIQDVELDFEL